MAKRLIILRPNNGMQGTPIEAALLCRRRAGAPDAMKQKGQGVIRFFYRNPKFPVLCDVQGVLIGARTPRELAEVVGAMQLPAGEHLPLVDASAEGWALVVDFMTVSPLTFKKHWTKKEVIAVFNGSKTARRAGLEYPLSSLSSKRFDRILREIVKLVLNANKSVERDRAT
jgi:hypothetical protein